MFGNKEVFERLDELNDQLGFVVAEMKVNGGATVKDKLDRIEEYVVLTNEIQHARMLDSDQMVFKTNPKKNIK